MGGIMWCGMVGGRWVVSCGVVLWVVGGWYRVVLYGSVRLCTVLCGALRCCTVLCGAVRCCTVL